MKEMQCAKNLSPSVVSTLKKNEEAILSAVHNNLIHSCIL
jgi:hypothetical protein